MEEMSISSSTHIDNSIINRQNEEENESLIGSNNINNDNNKGILISNNNDIPLKNSLFSENKDLMKIIVFDLGGGTYDVSIVYLEDNIFETMGYDGDQNLGGFDFDNKLIDYSLKKFCDENKYDENVIRNNYQTIERLKRACEENI